MDGLLKGASGELCAFLANLLPQIGDEDWWVKLVIDQLSFQQQRFVEERQIKELRGLDLAALLRVLDKNWFEIGWKVTLPPDARHFVKEMMSIRNRWAHASVQKYPRDDVYRDLDTLLRFLLAIAASETIQEEVQEERRKLIEQDELPSVETAMKETNAEEQVASAVFQPPQIVRLKSDPSKTGPVIAVQELDTENRYQVFVDGTLIPGKRRLQSQVRAQCLVVVEVLIPGKGHRPAVGPATPDRGCSSFSGENPQWPVPRP